MTGSSRWFLVTDCSEGHLDEVASPQFAFRGPKRGLELMVVVSHLRQAKFAASSLVRIVPSAGVNADLVAVARERSRK